MDLATLQRAHPQWNLVDFKVAPNGGIWALGADGGIFALDATGGTTGSTAPFYGSYTALAPEQRQGTRSFARLDVNQYGGYTAISQNQEQYAFTAPPTSLTPAANPVDTTNTQQATTLPTGPNLSAEAALHAVLDPLGLGSLAGDALNFLRSTPGATPDYVTQVWLPQQKTYKDAFPEIAAAQQKAAADPTVGTYIPTPADILNYRNQANEYVRQGLIPPELATRDQIGKLITGDVSIDEFRGRIENGWSELINGDPNALQAFLDYHPATNTAQAVAYLLDPTLGETAVNAAIAQAKIGGAAVTSGFGPISLEQATTLQRAGQGNIAQFNQAAMQNPLTQENVGESEDITQGTQIAAMTGNAGAQAQLERRLAQRQAAFQGGGGAATGGEGRTALG